MILEKIEKILDLKLEKQRADAWDNCGLLIGRKDKEIKRVLLALELTAEVLAEAKEKKCDMILTHHPAIFSGLKQITDNKGDNIIYQTIQADVAVYSAHTNFDIVRGGLNDYVAAMLGATIITVLDDGEETITRLFEVSEVPFEDFLNNIKRSLAIQTLRVIGSPKEKVKKVGMVTGAGGSYAQLAFENGADVFITGDIKYHEAMDFKHKGYSIIDAGHFETERIFPKAMHAFIEKNIKELDLHWVESEVEKSPFTYYSSESLENNLNSSNSQTDSLSLNPAAEKKVQAKTLKAVEIYTDGGSRGNPGDAAIGYVIKSNGENIYQYAENIGIQTNNVAEYQAVLSALKKAKELNISELTLYMDSQLVERQLNGAYKVKNEDLKILYDKIVAELKAFKKYEIIHVKRELNKLADKLVNMALDKQQTVEIEEI